MAIKKSKEDKVKKSAKKSKKEPVKAKKAKKSKVESDEEKPSKAKKSKKAKAESDSEPPKKAKKGKKAKDTSDAELFAFDAYADLDGMLDAIEKETGMSGGGLGKRVTTSTGLLTLDLILGGGLTAGSWNTFYGGEQSSKSTLSMTQLAHAAVTRDIPVLMYFDFEGSYDSQYMLSLARVQGFKGDITDLFGIQDDDGVYVKKPIIRKYSADVAEKFFNMVYKLEKNLPDKLYKKGVWWHVYEGTKENKAKYGSLANTKYLKKTGNLWIEAPNDQPQALIVVDSYPAMLPANMDDDDGKAGIGAQARMFSEQLKRVKGRMKSKAVTILGINQLRQKPMVMFGCFHYQQRVLLSDGNWEYIGKIVNQKLPVKVMSYNEKTRKLEPKKVVGWYNNGDAQQGDFLKIRVQTGLKSGYNDLVCTKNHKLLRYENLKMDHAANFSVGDSLSTYEQVASTTNDVWQLVYGSILGDGSFSTKRSVPSIQIGHSHAQHAYLMWKKEVLTPFNPEYYSWEKAEEISAKLPLEGLHGVVSGYKATKGSRVYSGLPTQVLEDLDLKGLAVWYMDDGTFYDSAKNHPNRHYWNLSISAKRLTEDQRTLLSEKITELTGAKFEVGGRKTLSNNTKAEIIKFHDAIAPYVHLSMAYKLYEGCKKVGSYRWKNKTSFTRKPWPAKIVNISEYKLPKGVSKGKYDLQVEGNHTYVVSHCIVHNSPEYEPGGEALKFFSDMRLKMVSRAVPPGEPRKKNSSNYAEEDSVEFKGLKDTYRYVHIRATKNKLSAGSDMEGWVRIWVRDGAGNAKGYDPVFDSYEFMKSIGILSGSRNRIKIDFDLLKVKGLAGSHSLSWNDFKRLIVGDKKQKDKVLASIKYSGKRFNLRDKLFSLIKSGDAQTMYFDAVKTKATDSSSSDSDD